jgi:fibronectin type 3 domain-containing protein
VAHATASIKICTPQTDTSKVRRVLATRVVPWLLLLAFAPAAWAVPGAPTGLTATTPTRSKPIALTWVAPVAAGSGIAGYNVYRGATKVNGATPVTALTYGDAAPVANASNTYTVKAVETGTGLEGAASVPFVVVYDTTAPPAPVGLAATTPTGTAPVLTWTAPTDLLSGVAGYNVYRGAATTPANTTLITATTYTDTGATPNASTTYNVKAVDNAGNVSAAAAKAVVYDTTAPTTPGAFTPLASQRTKPVLAWTASTDAGGAGLDHYEVFRGPTAGTGVDLGAATTTSFVDAALTAEGTYPYSIVAIDKAGNVSGPTAVKTVQYDVTAPTAPTSLAAGATPTGQKPTFAYGAGADVAGSGVATYRLYRNGTSVLSSPSLTITDTAVTTDGSYTYYVTTVDNAGNESAPSNQVTVLYDKTAPPAPTSLASGPSPTNLKPTLTWASGGPDALSGFAAYQVFRGATLVGTTSSTSFTDTALSTSGPQSYTVKTVDLAGNLSAASAPKSVVYDVVAPAVPASPSGPAATNVKPTIRWTASADSGGATLANYVVYRDGVQVGTATAPSYNETATVYPDGTYLYTASAVDTAGNESPQSTPVTVVYDTVAPGAPGTPTTAAPVTKTAPAISWTTATDPGGSGVARYQVYRDGAAVGTAAAGTSYIDSGQTQAIHVYTVRALDAAGNSSAPTAGVSITYDTTAPGAPTGLAGPAWTGTFPVLTWTAGPPDALSGFAHYDVFRAGAVIGSTTATTWTDTAPLASNSYTVKAVDLAGNASAPSTSLTITYDTAPPTAPGALMVTSPASTPHLSWKASTDAGGIGLYRISRDGTIIASTSSLLWDDTTTPGEGAHAYTVVAIDRAGNVGVAAGPVTSIVDTTPPPVPVGLAAVSPTNHQPVLTWTSGGNDLVSGFLAYQVYGNARLLASPGGATYTDAGPLRSASITYTVRAVDVAGNISADSAPITVVFDNQAPPAPTALTGPAVVKTTPHLTWFAGNPDDLSGFARFDVYRGGSVIGTTTGTTFDDVSISADGSYDYTVKAVDAAGNSSVATNTLTVKRDNAAPTIPTITTAPTPIRSQPTVTWSASTDGAGSGVVRYDVYRDNALLFSTSGLTYTDDTPLADGVYVYTLVAVDLAGNESTPSLGASIRVDTVAPPAPTGLTAPTPANLPHLTWTGASDTATGGSGIGAYRIYRSGVRVGTSAVADFADSTVLLDDTYDYTVTAVDGAGNESVPSALTTVLFDHTPPPAPAGLGGATPSQSRPDLTWSSGGLDALSGFDHYGVYRDGNLGGTPTAPAFTDAALPANGSYTYTVRAVDAAGNASVASNTRVLVWDTTAPDLPTGLAVSSPAATPVLTWTAAADHGGSNMKHYVVYRDGAPVTTTAAITWTDTDALVPEGLHTFAVQAVDNALNASAVTAPVSSTIDRTPPSTPLNATAATPTPRPVLHWDAAIDAGAVPTGTDHYDVYRASTRVGQTTGLAFSDDALALDGTYPYSVVAVDRAGNRAPATTALVVVFDKTPPPTPAHVVTRAMTPDAPSLTWNAGGTDNLSGLDHYDVYRDGNRLTSTVQPGFTDLTLSVQGAHTYAIRAVDGAGNVSAATPVETVVYDTTPPPPPTGLAVPTPTNLPRLSWDAGVDDDTGASGLEGYNVYRDGARVGHSVTTSWDDGSIPQDGSYAYRVTAVDKAGNESLDSRSVVITFDGTAPPAPEGVSGTTPTRAPLLTWTPVSDASTGGSPIVGYRVFRDATPADTTTGTTLLDSHPGSSSHHLYAVQAIDAAGNVSATSAPADVVVDLEGPVIDTTGIKATATTGVSTTMRVTVSDTGSGAAGLPEWDLGNGEKPVGLSVQHTFEPSGTYTITVKASDNLGNVTVETRTVRVENPPGGVPPKTLTVAVIRNQTMRLLKKTREVPIVIFVDVLTTVDITLERRGAVVRALARRINPGGARIVLAIPKSELRIGAYKVTVQARLVNLRATRTFRVK